MKRTLTINLCGIGYTIDEDAYNALQEYLHKLEAQFPNEDDREILSDIEQRIAEIFSERLGNKRQVVNMDDVNAVMETLGAPEQFDEEEETGSDGERGRSAKAEKAEQRKHRKFYRDTDNQILGGVAAGIAAYLGWDVTLVRIILLLIIILGFGYIIPAYLVVWLIAPEAKTTAQKLEMQGVEPSIENMKRYLESEQFKSSASRIGSRLGAVVLWLFRFAAIIFGISVSAVGIVVILALVYALVALMVTGGAAYVTELLAFGPMTEGALVALIVSSLVFFTIPLVSIVMATVRLLRRDKSPVSTRRKVWGWVWFGVWVVSFITLCTTVFFNMPHYIGWDEYVDVDEHLRTTERRLEGEEFAAISASKGVVVTLVPDTVSYVDVTASPRAMRNVEASVEDNILNLSMVKAGRWTLSRPTVEVHYKELNAIMLSSAASMSNDPYNPINTDHIDISATSAAEAKLSIACNTALLSSTSASEIKVAGTVKSYVAQSTSGASIDADQLIAQSAEARATSGAEIEVSADTISVSATSGANIEYRGKPYVKMSQATSGGVINREND